MDGPNKGTVIWFDEYISDLTYTEILKYLLKDRASLSKSSDLRGSKRGASGGATGSSGSSDQSES